MLVKEIIFPTSLQDIEDDNIDVFVRLGDGLTYVVVVATHRNIITLMNKQENNFLKPGCPFIIVKELTQKTIEKAIKAYTEDDAYWLKLYHFAGNIEMSILDKLKDEQLKESSEPFKLTELDQSENS